MPQNLLSTHISQLPLLSKRSESRDGCRSAIKIPAVKFRKKLTFIFRATKDSSAVSRGQSPYDQQKEARHSIRSGLSQRAEQQQIAVYLDSLP